MLLGVLRLTQTEIAEALIIYKREKKSCENKKSEGSFVTSLGKNLVAF